MMDVGQINSSLIYGHESGSLNQGEVKKLQKRVSELGIETILDPSADYRTYGNVTYKQIRETIQTALLDKSKLVKKPLFNLSHKDVNKALDFLILFAWHAQSAASIHEKDKTAKWMHEAVQRLEYLHDHINHKKENEVTATKALKKIENLYETLNSIEKSARTKKVNTAKKIISEYFK